jgi:2'-5' RNA ligase
VRAFLALPVGPPALGEVRAVAERASAEVAGARWGPIETAHLTLHFFGSIGAPNVERAAAAVQPVLSAQVRFNLRLAGLGCFPSEARARVLWMGVAGDTGALSELAAGCAAALAAAGFPVESRPYRPHCTLGRRHGPWTDAALLAWRSLAGEEPATSWFAADRAVLYESVTSPSGTQHLPRVTVPFGPSS